MKSKVLGLVALLSTGFVACGDDDNPGVTTPPSYTKSEAQALNGQTPDGRDICQMMGWYDDDTCDTFCVQTDPDCEVTPECDETTLCADGFACDVGVCVPISQPADCSAESACGEGSYCAFPPSDACGDDGAQGRCKAEPEGCDAQYLPVCGCDGMTYSNVCTAASAGQNMAADGECPRACTDADQCELGEVCGDDGFCAAGPTVCGARAGDTCTVDEFCFFTPTAMCGFADAPGVCEPRPQNCTAQYDPVCGCDQQTYSNTCVAASSGMGVLYDGACLDACSSDTDCELGETCENNVCVSAGVACGGRAGDKCDALTEWCDFGGPAAICGFADAQGTCAPRPDICTAVVDPVCGCNSETYNNSCEAHVAGVDIQYMGACNPPI